MKYIKLAIILLLAGCIDDPTPTPIIERKWVDVQTHTDTIITNPAGKPSILYYAIKNWKSFPDSNFSMGSRQVIGASGDSVLLSLVNPTTTKYYGPYFLKFNAAGDTLQTQNFLDTLSHTLPVRPYVLLQ